jgi:hypothetical protein
VSFISASASASSLHLLDADQRPEALLLHQEHAVVDAGEDGRLEPVALPLDALAAAAQRRALGEGIGHLFLEHRELRRAGDGADVGALGRRVADLEALHRVEEGGDEGVVDLLVDVDALDRAAALAGVVHRAVGERLGRGLRVGVLGDVGGILAAELELQPDHARTHRRGDARPGGGRAGEEHAVHLLLDQRGADLAAADHGDEHVRRHACGMEQPVDVQAGEGRELGRLVKDRVAGQQRRHEHVAADEKRIVPGGDVGDDAERLLGDALAHAGIGEDFLIGRGLLDLGEKKSIRPRKPFNSLRDWARGLPTSAVSVAARVSSSATSAARKATMAALRSARGRAAHAGCAARARAALAATLAASSAGSSAICSPLAGLVIFKVELMVAGRRVRPRESRREGAGRRACLRPHDGTRDATAPRP